MATKRKPPPEPAGFEELKNAALRLIVERFDGRPLDWQTPERALSLAAFEIKRAALKGRR